MRTGFAWLLGATIFAAAPAFAQSPLSLPDLNNTTMPSPAAAQEEKGPVPGTQVPPLDPPVNSEVFTPAPAEPYTIWVRAEYLLYGVKSTPLPLSLVTGNPANPTQELLNSDRSFGAFSGTRIGLGTWFDPDHTRGMEGSFFLLQRRSTAFTASSDGTGTPTLQFPFINQSPGVVGVPLVPIAVPGIFAGNVAVTSSLQLWGAEANGVVVLIPRQAGFEVTALAGIRYLDLQENLDISTVSSALLTAPNTVLAQNDHFGTRNQFYGGQIGARLNVEWERLALDMTAKLALGLTHQTVDIQGVSAQTGPGGVNGVFPGGLFAQPSNMGHFTANQFGVVPSIELKLHYFITSNLSAFVGYDFMYWNSVVRPGSQIDRNLNLTQSAVLGNGALNGPAFPTQQFGRTDFWAQGATFGFEFRY